MSLKPVKTSPAMDLASALLIPLVVALGLIALAFWIMPASADASMLDCIDATCRVSSKDSIGTGVVYTIENGRVFVLTNAHVATEKVMYLEFWRRGHKSVRLVGHTVLRSVNADVAVIAVDANLFKGKLPKVIPLAPMNYHLRVGQTVTSVGCAWGAWPTSWRGSVTGYYARDNDVIVSPPPANGRSGSAVFDECGRKIVALLHMRGEAGNGEIPASTATDQNFGLAVNLQRIYAAIYGKHVQTDYTVTDREVSWPPPAGTQCGPRGCPPSSGWSPVLPYRRQQEERYRQQGERDKLQDKRLQDLYPTLPKEEFNPPKEEVLPLPKEETPPPAAKEDDSPVALLVAGLLFFVVIGGLAGLVAQWMASHAK